MNPTKNEKDKTSISVYDSNYEYHSDFAEKYRHIFSSFAYFNSVQTKAIDTILYTNKSVVVSSPTESGKSVIFELAIIHFLETFEKCSNNLENSKIIYVAPEKTLCSERLEDWKNKFSCYRLKCVDIIDDTDIFDDLSLFSNYQLIITTPEKWDALTRKCKELKYQLQMIKLFLIDEVHLINEDINGTTLETIVSRMKMIPKTTKLYDLKLRFVAVSATVSNIEDIAKWLGSDQENSAHFLNINEDDRSVKLQKIVLGYNYLTISNSFKFDLDLTYKLKSLIRQYSNGQPTLIFCPTRKSVEFTCKMLVKDIAITLCDEKLACINENLKEINNNKIKEFVKLGIGCHHTGMPLQTRKAIEHLFRRGCLNILVATSTLGIDLLAHLVIIKSTEHYTFNGYREYNECQVLRMIGRAGRPEYDITATAIIMTKNSMKGRYEEILSGNQIVESHLHKHLIEQLNAEIVLGNIYDKTIVMDWIRSTFLYVRACRVPQKYGMIKTLNVNEIESTLQNLCLAEIRLLACARLINYNNNEISFKPEGEIMAKYLISFETMKSFMHFQGTENLGDLIRLLTYSKEFENIKLRKSEKLKLNILNKNKLLDADVIRFQIEEGINTRETKINCLIQATLGTLQIMDNLLIQEANKIILIAIRLAKAIREITNRSKYFEIARVACILVKCLTTKLWENSKFVSKLIPKIGPVLSKELVLNGKTTLQSIRNTNPRDLEQILNRHPPFGNYIHDFICQIPKYKVQASFDEYLELILIKISLIEYKNIPKNTRFHIVSILVGDSDNNLLKAQQIRNDAFFEQGHINMTVSLKNQILLERPNYTVTVCLISDQWVGIDVEVTFKPCDRGEHINESMNENNHNNLIVKSPLKTFSSPQPIKRKSTSKIDKNQKTQKKESKQMNIKTYFQNISSYDQDLSLTYKTNFEENKNIGIKNDANKSHAATQIITRIVPETQTKSINNRCTGEEYIKFDKDILNKYSYYDELINDDVFHDLFIPDDNFQNISKAFDSAIKKWSFKESLDTSQVRNSKNIIQHEVTETITKSNEITPEYVNQFSSNELSQLEDKENINPNKPRQEKKSFSSIPKPEITTCKLLNTEILTTPLSHKFTEKKKNVTTDYYFPKSIKTKLTLFSSSPSRTYTCNRSDNVNKLKFDTTSTLPETNIPVKNLNTSIIQSATVGRLSHRIKTNLQASSDFYVPLYEETQSKVISDNYSEKNTSISVSNEQTSSHRSSISTPIRTTCTRRSGKTMLDKYFKAVKTSRRPQGLSTDKFIVTKTAFNDLVKNLVDDGK